MTIRDSLLAQRAKILVQGTPRFEVVCDCQVVDVLWSFDEVKRRAWAYAWSHVGHDVTARESRVLDGQKAVKQSVSYRVDYVARLTRHETGKEVS